MERLGLGNKFRIAICWKVWVIGVFVLSSGCWNMEGEDNGSGYSGYDGGFNSNNAGWPCDGGLASFDAGGSFGNLGTGGAQDIGQFRKILDEGGIPGENTLSANGFFSEHYTELPPPDCGESICLHGMLGIDRDWVYNTHQVALQLAMNSPLDPTNFERRPLDLAVVVDVSGSMDSQDKITFVRQGLHLLINELENEDRLALITYSDDVTTVFGLENTLDATAMHYRVDALDAGGSTNFHDGLETGFQIVEAVQDPERESRVIMISDGMPTAGITDMNQIISMAESHLNTDVGLTTIGVGLQFNVDLMRGLAERGAGNFYFLEDTAAIEEVFVEELSYFVTPVAFDLDLSVTLTAAYGLSEVVGTTLWSEVGNGGQIHIPAVFLASRTSHDDPPATSGEGRRGGGSAIIMAINPATNIEGIEDPYQVATIALTYEDATDLQQVSLDTTVTNPALPGVHPLSANSPDPEAWVSHTAMRKNLAMYNIYLGLREACRRAVYNYNHALWVLDQLLDRAVTWNTDVEDEDIAIDIELMEQFRSNLMSKDATAVAPPDLHP